MSASGGANAGFYRKSRSQSPVLVVDDEEPIRRLYVLSLEQAGVPTVAAADGAEALALLTDRPFSAVILDNNMPGLSGLEVIRALREREETATLPIILVTGSVEMQERVQGLHAGASDYLTKPVDLEELTARVRSQLRGQAAWMDKVEGRLRERAAIARTLTQIKPQDTLEATSEVICFELSLLHQLSGVSMYSFGPGEIVMPLGRYGQQILDEVVGESLDVTTSTYLLKKAANGPWIERHETLCKAVSRDHHSTSATLAFVPLVADAQLLGLLALATEPSEPGVGASQVTHALSAAIDFATVAAGLLAPGLTERGQNQVKHAVIDRVISLNEFYPVFQPIVDLATGTVVGYEMLTRFTDGVRPDIRFIEATLLGRGVDLELATLERALSQAQSLPKDAFISINVSPALVLAEGALPAILKGVEREIVLELTEHERIDDYSVLRVAIDELGPEIRLSVDDAGSGFASLRHVLSLQPHFVKLDVSLVRDIHSDPARQALVAGIEYFATETSSRLIAEGIEYEAEMDTLRRLDVELGQGYLLGRPAPLDALAGF